MEQPEQKNWKRWMAVAVVVAIALAARSSAFAQLQSKSAPTAFLQMVPQAIDLAAPSRINGELTSGADVDLYRVSIEDPLNFRASTVGGTNFDTALFLFADDLSPVYLNDDAPDGLSLQSELRAQDFASPLSPGEYYLGVAAAGYEPVNVNGQLLFSPFWLSPTETRAGAVGVVPAIPNHFENTFGGDLGFGEYTLSISGAGLPAVPEPMTFGMAAGVLALLASLYRRVRRAGRP